MIERRRRFRVFRHIFRYRSFLKSFRYACTGIMYLFLYHQNMRLIFMTGVAAFLAGIFFRLNGNELVALCITIMLVFTAEIFNTAIELMLDMVTRKYHPMIKLVKDIAAAVVLLSVVNAIGVGWILFGRKIFHH
jgi:diacylglycerol kinase (ATP)